MIRALAICALVGGIARADAPYSIAVTGGAELAPLADDDLLGRATVEVARRWGRWQLGARGTLASGSNDVNFVDEETLEGGVWLNASPRLDVLLAWRAGRAGFHFPFGFVNTFALEPAAQLAFRVTRALDIRIEPLALHFYRSSVWQMTFGPEVGVAWRL